MLTSLLVASLVIAAASPPESDGPQDRAERIAESLHRLKEFRLGRAVIEVLSRPNSDKKDELLKPYAGMTVAVLARWPSGKDENALGGENEVTLHFVDKQSRRRMPRLVGAVWIDYLVIGNVLKIDAKTKTILLEVDDHGFEFLQSG